MTNAKMVIAVKMVKKVFKWYPGMAFRHRIVCIVTSPAFQLETNVLTDNVYLTSRELSARIPLLHSLLFICNNSTTL